MRHLAVLTSLLAISLSAAHAERADSFKKTEIKARDSSTNLVTNVTTLTGDVEIRRGTLLIQAATAVLTEDAQGFQHIVLMAKKSGPPIFFRQKRDGDGDQWMEGESLQAEYDGKTEVVDLLNQAKARRSTEGRVTDEVSGEHISYNSRDEVFLVTRLPGEATTGDRRGTMVLQPRRNDLLPSPASSTASTNGQ